MSSILDIAAGPAQVVSSGPQHFTALREATHDTVTGRTYQLVKRDSDSVPYCVSSAGNHPEQLAALNQSRALTHERAQLVALVKRTSKQDERVVEIKALLSKVLKVSAERTDRTARMLSVYSEQGVS